MVILKKKQMYDCLVDIYYIILSDVFIPSLNSGLSLGIIDMVTNNYTIFPNISSKTIIEWGSTKQRALFILKKTHKFIKLKTKNIFSHFNN